MKMKKLACLLLFAAIFNVEAGFAEANAEVGHATPSVVKKLPAVSYDSLLNSIDASNLENVSYIAGSLKTLNVLVADGLSPLHYAVFCNNAKVVQILLNKGANPNFKTDDGLSALDIALLDDQKTVAKELFDKGGGVSPQIASDLQKFGCTLVYDPKTDVYRGDLTEIFAVMEKINAKLAG